MQSVLSAVVLGFATVGGMGQAPAVDSTSPAKVPQLEVISVKPNKAGSNGSSWGPTPDGVMGKNITVISDAVMEIMQRHAWPGNIRELQNFIERAVILSPGAVLLPPLDELKGFVPAKGLADTRTMVQAERDHILYVLERAGGVVGGREGAAERLGMPRTTLISRMRKLGLIPD